MKTLYRLLAAAGIMTVLLAGSGCSSTRLSTSWRDTEAAGESFRKPLVLAISDTQALRTTLEDEYVRVLAKNGVTGVQSYKTFPDLSMSSKDDIKDRLPGLGCDSVLVTHLVDTKKEQIYVPGAPAYRYPGFGPYYTRSYTAIRSPGYRYEALTYVVETNLYNARNEQLVWTARTETDGDTPLDSAVKDFVQVITKNMMQHGVFQP